MRIEREERRKRLDAIRERRRRERDEMAEARKEEERAVFSKPLGAEFKERPIGVIYDSPMPVNGYPIGFTGAVLVAAAMMSMGRKI